MSFRRLLLSLAGLALVRPLGSQSPSQSAVKAWEEDIVLPTYELGPPEPNPIFFFGRASQGAEGRVYPYPLYDRLTHRKVPRKYHILYLENEYVRLGIVPELGGRLFEAGDKTNGYHFIYRQHVIKPALIGLIGAWISGGIEWNIPHHHRATTMLPVQYRLDSNPDGSKTVWVGELEIRHRMRWAVGYTLHPGKAYLEARVRILNRTPLVQTMLCWANVAVHVNENYQIIFPPRTQWGTHHHKREFIAWPVARGRYGGADFSQGVDVSWYRNHWDANSIFAWNYEEDFLAGYDHGKQAGIIGVADHHIVPGKKVWTWGTGPRGRMWEKILTDEDGPYIELMVGAYSDNQPDYSWLQPFETKSFEMYWYPFRAIGGVKNANREAAVNLETAADRALLGFCTTAFHRAATVTLSAAGRTLLRETVAIGPAHPYRREVALPPGTDPHTLRASLTVGSRELIAYAPVRLEPQPMPEPVKPPPPPERIASTEELYLTGLRIEQFHHPTLDPDPYWEEALRRDPRDVRVNTALGILYLKKARFADAERHLRIALERLTDRYTTPKDAEPLYYLGLALKAQGRLDEAYRQCYAATWSMAWRAPAYYCLAEIATARGQWNTALDHLERSLEANALNPRALGLKAALLRRIGRPQDSLRVVAEASRRTDPLDVRFMAERWLAEKKPQSLRELVDVMRRHPATALELAAEYLNAALWEEGTSVLQALVAADKNVSPLVHYYLGFFAAKQGRSEQASSSWMLAAKSPPDTLFPFQHEMIEVLGAAIEHNPRDPRAPFHLGNLLYDWQPERAIGLWERSASLDDSFPIALRNLAIAYARAPRGGDLKRAVALLEKAISLPDPHPLHFAELDALYQAAGAPPEKRLEVFERNHEVVSRHDEALAREIGLKVLAGKYDEAIRLLASRRFSVWEGGSLNVADDWIDAHLLRGRRRLDEHRPEEALRDFQAALPVPDNLPWEGRASASRQTEVFYWIGEAFAASGRSELAREYWTKAIGESASGQLAGGRAPTAQTYYRARALERLGRQAEARTLFEELVRAGAKALQDDTAEYDFFASFGERQSRRNRLAAAHYLKGLGHLGLDEREQAREAFREALSCMPGHLGARAELARLGR